LLYVQARPQILLFVLLGIAGMTDMHHLAQALVNQKIMVFELQKEKSKQSKWMG
jgi:hypothetical protein